VQSWRNPTTFIVLHRAFVVGVVLVVASVYDVRVVLGLVSGVTFLSIHDGLIYLHVHRDAHLHINTSTFA